MKIKAKKAILKTAAKIALGTAQKACGASSWWECYQPKEPTALKKSK